MIINPLKRLTGNKYTALDFGHHSLKMVHCSTKGGRITLHDTGRAEMQVGTVVGGDIRDPSLVASGLQKMLDGRGIRPGRTLFAPASSQMVLRPLEMPHMNDDELEEALRWEAEEYLPLSAEDISFDYFVSGEGEEQQQLVLVVISTDVLKDHLQVLERAHLRPRVANAADLALISLLTYQGLMDETSAVINMGAEETRIVIADESKLHLSRSVEIGGGNFTRDLVNGGFKESEAEKKKRELGLGLWTGKRGNGNGRESDRDEPGSAPNGARRLIEELASEVSRSLAYYSDRNQGADVGRVFLTGGASLLSGLREALSSVLEREIAPLEPLSGIELKTEKPGVTADLAVALGLVASEVLHS